MLAYLYSRTFKRPSSTPAFYQRCEKTQNTILQSSNTHVFVTFSFLFPSVRAQPALLHKQQRARHCWQGNIMPCEIEGVFLKINSLGMQVMWYHHPYLSTWKQHFKPWFLTHSALPSLCFPQSNVLSLWIMDRYSFTHNMKQKNQSFSDIFFWF